MVCDPMHSDILAAELMAFLKQNLQRWDRFCTIMIFCKVSVITPLTTELPAGIAEFANQYPEIREKENAEWPDWITTIKKEPKNHLGALEQDHMTGEWLPCRIPQGKPDLIILEGVRRNSLRLL